MPRISPKRPRLLNQPTSIGWFDLPAEMREIVIDEMDPKTRCRFAQCSKLCEKEAKESKNYMYKITLMCNEKNCNKMELHLSHRKESKSDFCLQFVDVEDSETVVIYKCQKPNSLKKVRWRKMQSGFLEGVRLKYLKEYLEKYKNSVRVFVFDDDVTGLYDFDVKNLRRLEKIDLKNIPNDDEDVVECDFVDRDQLMSIDHLGMAPINFPFDQIFDFKGETVIGGSIGFDEKKVNKYLIMLKNGESRLKHLKIDFEIKNKIHDIKVITKDLDVIAQHRRRITRSDYLDDSDDEDIPVIRYSFNFRSENRENGEYYVIFEARHFLEINWKPTE